MYSVRIIHEIVQYLWHVLKSSISQMYPTHIENDDRKSTKTLHGKTVIVTGANTGIGKHLDLSCLKSVQSFAEEKAS